ncbi:S24 family peptidase [Pseudomonas sp. REB1044]|uniref:S24 family peptidase n=1 Tax=Pseudomonas sp. REB1044 TaxID=2675224 RepID=UPI00315D4C6D
MLTGADLGAAIESARKKKNVTKKKLADDFGVAAPSVQGWVKFGRIKKSKLMDLITYFSDVVPPAHWGLEGWGAPSGDSSSENAQTISVEGLPAPLAQKIKSYRNLVDVPRYDVEGSMGPGSEPPDINMVVEHMSLDANWVRQNLTYTKLENLKLISGRGDSMAPTIRSGDAVLVDAGVTTVEDDAIYFFLMRGKLQIKRIQRGLDGLTIISDNGQYPPIEVPGDREADITVLAQIIYWWTGRSF